MYLPEANLESDSSCLQHSLFLKSSTVPILIKPTSTMMTIIMITVNIDWVYIWSVANASSNIFIKSMFSKSFGTVIIIIIIPFYRRGYWAPSNCQGKEQNREPNLEQPNSILLSHNALLCCPREARGHSDWSFSVFQIPSSVPCHSDENLPVLCLSAGLGNVIKWSQRQMSTQFVHSNIYFKHNYVFDVIILM